MVSSAIRRRFSGGTEVERTHVVRAIGQLDQDHAAHRAPSPAASCGSSPPALLLAAVEFAACPAWSGHPPVPRPWRPNFSASSLLVTPWSSITSCEQRGHDRLDVQLPVRAQFRHRHRVGDVGLAALAVLAQVGLVANGRRGGPVRCFRWGSGSPAARRRWPRSWRRPHSAPPISASACPQGHGTGDFATALMAITLA